MMDIMVMEINGSFDNKVDLLSEGMKFKEIFNERGLSL